MLFCDNEFIKIESDVIPIVMNRLILPNMTIEEKKEIDKKPYINYINTTYSIHDEGKEYSILIPKGYTWDGATIPSFFKWLVGCRCNPEFLIASCVHDKICENKYLVNYNRKLASLILRELLIACECNRIKAYIMYYAVELYQKYIRKWN